jgi:hypothetical protein
MRLRLLAGVLTVLLATTSTALAQERRWGAKVGINLATLSVNDDDPDVSYDFRIGVAAGGYFTLPLGSRLELQPEALFSQQGGKVGASDGVSDVDSTIALDMLTIPILVKFRLAPAGNGLAVYGGPSIGLTLRARAISDFGGEKIDLDISDEVESTDFGVAAGAMFEKGRWTLDGRYTFGLSKLSKDPADPEIKSRVISILVGVRF